MNNIAYGLLSGPSLVSSECLVKNLPNTFGAYIYKFTNIENNMIYIGYKVCVIPGEFVPSYWSSSTNQVFIDLTNGDKPILKFEVISVGTEGQMEREERRILTAVNAPKNPMYYNLGMIGKDKAPKMSVVLNLFENIGLDPTSGDIADTAKYDVVEESIDKVLGRSESFQSRDETYVDSTIIMVRREVDKIKSIINTLPLVELGGKPGVNSLIISGNNTGQGIDQSTQSNCKLIYVPYEDWSHLTNGELNVLGLLFNPQDEIRRVAADVPAVVRHIVNAHFESDVHWTDPSHKLMMGQLNFQDKEREKAIRDAKNEIEKILHTRGNFINYKVKAEQEKLEGIRESYTRGDTNPVTNEKYLECAFVLPSTSRSGFLDEVISKATNFYTEEDKDGNRYFPKLKKIWLVVYHTTRENAEWWVREGQSNKTRYLNMTFQKHGIDIGWLVQPTER